MSKPAPQPNFTQSPNVLFDDWLTELKEAELRIALVVTRFTFGWHKAEEEFSVTRLAELTGMSRRAVISGIDGLMTKGILRRRPKGQSYLYALVIEGNQSEAEVVTLGNQLPDEVVTLGNQPNIEVVKESKDLNKDDSALPEKPKAKRPVNPTFDAVAEHVFGIDPHIVNGDGGRIAKISAWLKKAEQGSTPPDVAIREFKTWYQRRYPGISLPRDLAKFQEHWGAFKQGGHEPVPDYSRGRKR
jgi:hypothetical protein